MTRSRVPETVPKELPQRQGKPFSAVKVALKGRMVIELEEELRRLCAGVAHGKENEATYPSPHGKKVVGTQACKCYCSDNTGAARILAERPSV
jgi:hypothetical protein